MLRKVPLIVILGSTGTGKTKLSLELAERFGGEIISADSMQVYANLDIVTAKATKEEQSRAKHHLLDVATPSEPFTVVHFRNSALPIIDKLLEQSKLPIVVGGTNYYIESLLWDILVSPKNETPKFGKRKHQTLGESSSNSEHCHFTDEELERSSSAKLHEHLKEIDPETANRLHPNNKRKIRRAIEFYQDYGQTLSSKLLEQRTKPGGNRLGGPLRYPHTILFWLRCQQDILNERLDKRVDAMLQQGLLSEIRAFHQAHYSNSSNKSPSGSKDEMNHHIDVNDVDNAEQSFTRGVLQTIGYKEFIPYLTQFSAENDQEIEKYLKENSYKLPKSSSSSPTTTAMTSGIGKKPSTEKPLSLLGNSSSSSEHDKANGTLEEELDSEAKNVAANHDDDDDGNEKQTRTLPEGLLMLSSCLNELKLVTKRYSKKQIKWINNRFLASKDRQVPDLYELDTSNVADWQHQVSQKAFHILEAYRNNEQCQIEAMAKRLHPGLGLNEETSNFCETCQRYFIGEYQWQLHLKSNKHKKRAESQRKIKKQQQHQRLELKQSREEEMEKPQHLLDISRNNIGIRSYSQSRTKWIYNFPWVPVEQNKLYTHVDVIYKESLEKYGKEMFQSYAMQKRLHKRFLPQEKVMEQTHDNELLNLLYCPTIERFRHEI